MVAQTSVKRESPMLQAALAYAQRGWHVFPLAPNTKVPLIAKRFGGQGCLDATTNDGKIRDWWTKYPSANIGWAMGKGLVAIDEDTYKGADLSAWRLPPTLQSVSARGGRHHIYHYEGALPSVKENELGLGICIKAEGGYIVAPPSRFQGKQYAFVDPHQPLVALPERIAELIRKHVARTQTQAPATVDALMAPTKRQRHQSDREDAGAHWLDWAMAKTGAGMGDTMGLQLAQQLLIAERNGAHVDVRGVLRAYARQATLDPHDPFDERSVERWMSSAQKSELVQRGEPARSQRPMRAIAKKSTPTPAAAAEPEVREESAEGGDDDSAQETDPEALLEQLQTAGTVDAVFKSSAQLAALDAADYGRVKAALKKSYGKSLNLNDLDAAVRVMRAETTQGKHREKLPITKMVADAIAELGECFAVDAGGRLWVFRDGVYAPNGKTVVHRLVKSLLTGPMDLPEHWSTHQADEVVAYIAVDAPELWERPPVDRVNVRNGILTLSTCELAPHTPDFLSPVQLPISYDPAATCPHWESFIATTFPEDAQQLPWEIIAWLMTPDTSIQKAILLLGEGGNGKSTFLAAVSAFLGKLNISAIPLQKLEIDRFVVSRLVGKLANICADLPSVALAGTSMFKAITGGDPILAEDKFKTSFDFTPFARLLFSANTPPQSPDATQAFYDRWVAIPFTGRFRGESGELDRASLDAELADPSELSGVLNKALEVWPELRRRRRFTEPASVKDELNRFREVTDPLSIWLDANTVAGTEIFTAKEVLFQAYAKHAHKEGRASGTKAAFGKALKRARPSITEGQRMVAGVPRTHVWEGIGLMSKYSSTGNGGNGSNGLQPTLFTRRQDTPLNEEEAEVRGTSAENKDKQNPVTPVTSVTEILDLAEAAGWPQVQLAPAEAIAAGQSNWRRFVAGNDREKLMRALDELQRQAASQEVLAGGRRS